MSAAELAGAVALLTRVGVRRVRLTGGEPLLRRDCSEVVRALVGLPAVEEVSVTTNGERLALVAGELRDAGLARVNVHLDTLRPERFRHLTGRDGHADVLLGLAAARAAGLTPLKVNVVLMKGINDDELVAFCRWAMEEGINVRFIELMDTGPYSAFVRRHFLSGAEARALIRKRHRLVSSGQSRPGSPAREYLLDGGAAVIGFIEAETRPFCEGCNRLRISHDGRLSTCLFGGPTLALLGLGAGAAPGSNPAEAAVRAFLAGKAPAKGVAADRGPDGFSMASIGG